jgi:hypothetical protein
MYCLLYRIETGKEPNVASYLVTNAVFILGFFTLALLLGEQQHIVAVQELVLQVQQQRSSVCARR